MPPSVRVAPAGGSTGRNCRRASSSAFRPLSVTPACTLTVRSSGLYSRTVSRRRRSTATSSSWSGNPSSRAEPLPTGQTTSDASAARATTAASASTLAGATSQRGRTPSRITGGSGTTLIAPTRLPSASVIEPVETLTPSHPGAGGERGTNGPEALAASRMRGQELGGIHDAVGIEDAAQAVHEIQVGVGVLEREILGLVHADAVLAGDAAPEGNARAQHLLVGALGPLQLARIPVVVTDERMEIAVAGMKDIGDEHAVARGDGAHLAHDHRQLGPRHHRVLEEVGGREPPHGAGGRLAPSPQQGAFGIVAGQTHLERPVLAADGGDPLSVHADLGAGAVDLDE